MVSAKSAQPAKLIARLTQELKKTGDVKPAEWSRFVKSGAHRTRPPQQDDFWYTRSAAVLRRIYLDGPVGVQRLRTFYGTRKKRGHAPPRRKSAGGSMIRKILQQLEAAGYVQKDKKGGRKITAKGRKFLDNTAKVAANE